MGCRFIFPESRFQELVSSNEYSGLATESSSNRFSILLSALFPLGNIETLQSPGNRGFEGRKSSVGSTVVYMYVRQNPTLEFGIQI